MNGDLYSLALTVPWCMTAEALEAMLSMAARDALPEEEIARRMHGPRSLALRGGKRRDDSGRMTMRDSVAVIPIDGPIYRYADIFTRASGGVTTDSLARDLQTALDDPKVSGILFAIDSPGGEVTGINELSDAIYAARGRKPIVAYVEGYGASAAYWIASAADVVVADSTALLGSIGTIMGVPDPTKRPSYRIDFVSTQSPKKRPDVTTDEGRAVIQQMVDDLTEVFISQVARNRGLERAQILAIEGGMLVGQHAVDAGLADALGSEESAAAALARGALPALGPSPLKQALPSISALLDMRATQEVPMPSWTDFWRGAKEAGIIPETSTDPAPAPTSLQSAAPTQAHDERDQELARLRAALAQAQAEQIQKDARAFVASHAQQTYPAEAQALAALYIRAAEIDQAHPRTDGQPSCVALLEAATTARPKHQLGTQVLAPDAAVTVLTNNTDGADKELTDVRSKTERYAERQNGKRR